jgi:hypothetical protein
LGFSRSEDDFGQWALPFSGTVKADADWPARSAVRERRECQPRLRTPPTQGGDRDSKKDPLLADGRPP